MKPKKLPKNQRLLTSKTEETRGVTVNIQLNEVNYLCPFCLHQDSKSAFETKTAKGKPSKKFVCPECNQKMREKSLTQSMSASDYAEWVFLYASYGFWKIVKYAVWNKRLKELGLAPEFWDRYKELKAGRNRTFDDQVEMSDEERAKAEFNRDLENNYRAR